jgi:hypothetical protein
MDGNKDRSSSKIGAAELESGDSKDGRYSRPAGLRREPG